MKTGLSLVELAQKIEGQKALKKDFIVDTSVATMQVQNGDVVLEIPSDEPKPHILDLPVDNFPIMPVAHRQIGDRLGIPGKYYDRMKAEAPDLLATNVNAWFRKNPEKRMVRTIKGVGARAFLSNAYNRIENEEIAEVALPVLLNHPEVRIVSSEITDRRMYIQAVFPKLEGEVKRGDVVQAGVVISNSEVGHGAVSISPMIYRLVCLNGMISADGKFRANHVGSRNEDTDALYRDDTKAADDRAILLKVRDHVANAVDIAAFQARVAKMSGLTEMLIAKGEVERSVEVLAKKVGVGEGERKSILHSLIEGGDLSAWGILNAVTAQAHDAVDYDRAVEFEKLGGQLLELPKSEWRELLAA